MVVTGGRIVRTETGEVVYVFSRYFRSILVSNSWRAWLAVRWRVVQKWASYGVRAFFGIGLIASIALVTFAIIVILLAITFANSSNSSGGGGGGSVSNVFNSFNHGGGGGGGGYHHHGHGHHHGFFNDFFFLMWWNNSFDVHRRRRHDWPRPDPPGNGPPPPPPPQRALMDVEDGGADPGDELSFLEAVFSFLFGDADPNFDLEERRLTAIVALIRANNGLVTAQQVAPYLDDVLLPSGADRWLHEGFMIPVLSRLGGQPVSTDDGQLRYTFPQLSASFASAAGAFPLQPHADDDDAVFYDTSRVVPFPLFEQPLRFSKASDSQKVLVVGLGLLNLLLVLFCGFLLQDESLDLSQLGPVVQFVSFCFTWIVLYAVFFLSLPLLRYGWILYQNSKISARNNLRQARVAQFQGRLDV
eukprot:TRINITY_DN7535_c0_g1_i1.p1 TRINITY_DN7535_c0_g1~~TRINITY_DN7535_c0_g1_i1.p1  ORF type:complete len:415 (+),score=144.45 TRINITY_DN7535_c0_g1_i1:271-1515(+)